MPVVVRLLEPPPQDSEATASEGCPQTRKHSSSLTKIKLSSPNPLTTKEWELGISEGCSPAATSLLSKQSWSWHPTPCNFGVIRFHRDCGSHANLLIHTRMWALPLSGTLKDGKAFKVTDVYPLKSLCSTFQLFYWSLLKLLFTIIFLPTFLRKGHPTQTCFLPWFCWEVLCGSYWRLSGTCVETHLALYLDLLEDMFQALVCQAWFIQSELVSPKKKKRCPSPYRV